MFEFHGRHHSTIQSMRQLFLVVCLLFMAGPGMAQGDVVRGRYLANAAGCVGCHTDAGSGGMRFAGGRALDTPFGTFYGPNITPDARTGIGSWTEKDFRRALRFGERPDGANYFPAFPYPAFSGMSDSDIGDLWAYMRSLPAVERLNREHRLDFPFGWRFLVTFWKWLWFSPGPLPTAPERAAIINRGAYLVRALGHCAECHSPRNALGAIRSDQMLAGAKTIEGRTPNLTPTRLKKWSDAELKSYLMTGLTPQGDAAIDAMSEVITNTTSQLTDSDLNAMIAYLRSLPELPEIKK